jgi:uncharacterized protein YgbK (DUF1537 family)
VDSVLRGHVATEVEAIAQQLDLEVVLLVPANPSLGRIIREGHYFVRGRQLAETDFARDPEHPRLSSNVRDLLKPSGLFPIHVCRPRDALPDRGIIVGEAESSEDLRQWAGRRTTGLLPAGGAEFFGALLDTSGYLRKQSHAQNSTSDGQTDRRLFVCGTSSESTRGFIDAQAARHTPVFSLPAELAQGADFPAGVCERIAQKVVQALESNQRVILHIGLPQVRELSMARRLVVHLARLAETVLRQVAVRELYAEGGATAQELAKRMGWARLKVWREWAPGVVTLVHAGNESLKLTIKPGSYVWPEAWTK